jgi:uncharacterized protein YpmS
MTDPVWSVIFMVFLSLVLAGLMIAYVFYLIQQENKDGQVREQGQEGSIEAESRQRDCEES